MVKLQIILKDVQNTKCCLNIVKLTHKKNNALTYLKIVTLNE